MPHACKVCNTLKTKTDLHVHTSTGSDGNLPVEEVFREAARRSIGLISVTDHDSIGCQEEAAVLARQNGMSYVSGLELNVTFEYPVGGSAVKSFSLDFLGYRYNPGNADLKKKLQVIREHREKRAGQILERLNAEFDREGIARFNEQDIKNIWETVDGAFGRPHIANYLVQKGIVESKQEAFDRYLMKCDVPKYPLSLAEASRLVRNAGGILVLAHPNDPQGTSLIAMTSDLHEQTRIIERHMLEHIDGLECWHSRHDAATVEHYVRFARRHGLVMTGGSDCHQKPLLLGTVDVPDWVAGQLLRRGTGAASRNR